MERNERRKVWLIGRRGSNAIEYARVLREESRLHFEDGMAAEIGYAQKVAGLERTSALMAPFRAPHHTVSSAAMTGKLQGHRWQPGELSLAHGGVLFLDDATELGLGAVGMIESAWRNGCLKLWSSVPKELAGGAEGAGNALCVPTWFSLVVYTLPCPCGNRGAPKAPCPCTDREIEKFHERVRPLTKDAEIVRLDFAQPSTVG